MRESFEHFYMTKVALGEGCGCAEHVTRIREIDAYAASRARAPHVADARRPLLGFWRSFSRHAWRACCGAAPGTRLTPIPEPVGDGIAAVAAEILLGDLHAGRRLPALVLGDVEQVLDALAPWRGRGRLATIASTSISFSTRLSRMSSSTG